MGIITSPSIAQARSATLAIWTAANPVLAAGEIVYESDSGCARIGDGVTAYTLLPYLNANSDPYFAWVTLLLKGNGTNGSQTIIDSSKRAATVTATGAGTTISTTSPKYGTGSIEFSGSSTRATVAANNDFLIGLGAFTFECWIYPLRVGQAASEVIFDYGVGGTNYFEVYRPLDESIQFFYNGSSTSTAASKSPINTWTHIAVCRSGTGANLTKIFINGVTAATFTCSVDFSVSRTPSVGGFSYTTTNTYNGRVDDLRWTNGIARYTADFTPPTKEL